MRGIESTRMMNIPLDESLDSAILMRAKNVISTFIALDWMFISMFIYPDFWSRNCETINNISHTVTGSFTTDGVIVCQYFDCDFSKHIPDKTRQCTWQWSNPKQSTDHFSVTLSGEWYAGVGSEYKTVVGCLNTPWSSSIFIPHFSSKITLYMYMYIMYQRHTLMFHCMKSIFV